MGLASPAVAAEFVRLGARFVHNAKEFPLHRPATKRGLAIGGGKAARWWEAGSGSSTAAMLSGGGRPCLAGLPGQFVSRFSELAPGERTAIIEDQALMRAIVGGFTEAVAEAVLPADGWSISQFFVEAVAGGKVQQAGQALAA